MHTLCFKLEVVHSALDLPSFQRRIKPTCRKYSSYGLQPVQVRRWIKQYTGLVLLLYAAETMHPGSRTDRHIILSPSYESTTPMSLKKYHENLS